MPLMPTFSISKRKQLRERINELEREKSYQQTEHDEKERRLQLEIRQREKEEFRLREQERQRIEDEQRRREAERIRQDQERMYQQELEEQRRTRQRQTSSEALRQLRELIRARYQMDIEIWNYRGVRYANQHLVIEQGRKADAIMREIYEIVGTWEPGSWTVEEWKVARRIKDQILGGGQRKWEGNPPWHEMQGQRAGQAY